MQSSNKLINILVTGANKGIGYGIVKSLLEKQLQSNEQRYRIIFTSRDEERGKNTLAELSSSLSSDLKDFITYRQLDITNKSSVDACINWLKTEFGNIDILLNNAGTAFKGDVFNTDVFDVTFGTNVFGTIDLTEKILENNLINKAGKIIIVASSLGNIKPLAENLKEIFRNENMTLKELIELAYKFRTAIENKTYESEGWGKNCYAVSKMIINKYTKIVAQQQEILKNQIQVYSCCPGWVRTDMGGPNAFRSLEEGVICPVYLVELEHALNPLFQGKFFYDCKVTDNGL